MNSHSKNTVLLPGVIINTALNCIDIYTSQSGNSKIKTVYHFGIWWVWVTAKSISWLLRHLFITLAYLIQNMFRRQWFSFCFLSLTLLCANYLFHNSKVHQEVFSTIIRCYRHFSNIKKNVETTLLCVRCEANNLVCQDYIGNLWEIWAAP